MSPARRAGEPIPRGASDLPSVVTRFPDHYAPPVDGTVFTRTGWYESAGNDVNVPAALVFRIPDDYEGVIRSFSQYVNDMAIADVISWQIRLGGMPVNNWNDIRMFPALASFRTVSDDPYIILPEGTEVSVQISNLTALAKRLGASYSGWFWPSRKRTM